MKFGASVCEMCSGTSDVQQSVRAKDPIVYRTPEKPAAAQSFITFKLIKRIVFGAVMVFVAQNYQEVSAWTAKTASPYVSPYLTKIKGLVPDIKKVIGKANVQNMAVGKVVEAQLLLFASGLNTYRTMNDEYPNDFGQFIRENYTSEAQNKDMTLDPWGTPFQYAKRENGYELRSAGADKMMNTSDDVKYEKN